MLSAEMPAAKFEPLSPQSLEGPAKRQKLESSPKTQSAKKVIKAPGQVIVRTAQACDRCRAKKSRCDGKVPDCSSCLAVGIKCIVSDKLSRRAFPKGYTETLEEYVRQLEAENTKLQGLVHLRDEQLARTGESAISMADTTNQASNLEHSRKDSGSLSPMGSALGPQPPARSLLPTPKSSLTLDSSAHHHNKSCACCVTSAPVHDRPVSLAGSAPAFPAAEQFTLKKEQEYLVADAQIARKTSHDYHIQQQPAPGAFAAASAFEQMHNGHQENENSRKQLLTNLVAAAIPRSTEETLFVPTLLAKVCQVHGFNSSAARLTAKAIALLKEFDPRATMRSSESDKKALGLIMDVDGFKLGADAAFLFLDSLQLPPKMELDNLLSTYFQNWGSALPILDKSVFMKNYKRYCDVTDNGYLSQGLVHSFEQWERLGALLVLTTAMALLSLKGHYLNTPNLAELAIYHDRLSKYNHMICHFIKPNCILTKFCSIESLQILAMSLQYCLAVGDVATAYELRGRVITMAQQLRLHRCPAAVLGLSMDPNDAELHKFMQAERRVLFWCVYCLDAYSSLILGLPRLLKDDEVECAMPFSDAGDNGNNESVLVINNTRLTIFGKVTPVALCFMQYCKVLGGIVDSVFSRSRQTNEHETAMRQDRIIDCWRRDLPAELKFQIDVNGFSLMNNTCESSTNWAAYSRDQIFSIFLYYHAKILIYLPILSKYGNHHNVGLSAKEQLNLDQINKGTVVTSMSMIQQSAIRILELLKNATALYLYVLPVPFNVPREQARFALLVAKGSMDYIKGGVLHQNLKKILQETFEGIKFETDRGMFGALSKNSASLLEHSVASILNLKTDLMKTKQKTGRKRASTGVPKPAETVDLPALADPYNFLLEVSSKDATQPETVPVLDPNDLASFDNGKTNEDMSNSVPSSVHNDGPAVDPERCFSDLFAFDPFEKELNNELMVSEFVADGSLGLFPFITENIKDLEDDRLSDCMGEDGAFNF